MCFLSPCLCVSPGLVRLAATSGAIVTVEPSDPRFDPEEDMPPVPEGAIDTAWAFVPVRVSIPVADATSSDSKRRPGASEPARVVCGVLEVCAYMLWCRHIIC